MIEVGNAIMENGGTRELEKLLEEAHGGREKRIRRSIFGGTEKREVCRIGQRKAWLCWRSSAASEA
jgi:hypothetical protein